MIRVVLDTNVLISAFEFGGPPREVFLLAASGLLTVYTSRPLLEELTRVPRERFRYSEEHLAEVNKRLLRLCTLVEPAATIDDCTDPDDNRVLECAVAAGAQFIVTGDNALLRLSPFRAIRIVNAAWLLRQKPWVSGREGV